ncbi:MAG: conjugal transfer protein TraD [Candidatus Eisenbacteria bacterium]|nr:conjugal transfer protein TraD [Candidatus Eisenbacteria bacterium]
MSSTTDRPQRDNSPEARRERAIKRQEAAAQTLKSIAEAERRARTRRLIALGATVDTAELGSWHDDTLLGALLSLKTVETREDWTARERAWREAGASFRLSRRAERKATKSGVPVSVEFALGISNSPESQKELRAAGLRLVPELGVWVGTVDLEQAYAVVTRYGGVLTRRE